MPKGFLCPPEEVVDNIIGKIGQIHGARIVTSPDIKAKIKRISISVIKLITNSRLLAIT